MKITSHLLITASFFYFTACSEVDDNSAVNTEKPENVSFSNNNSSNTEKPENVSSVNTSSSIIAPATDSNELLPSTTLIQAEKPAATAGMNPPHGEQGHRCDIPVGAPLNSAPANTNAVQINSAQQPNLSTTTTLTPPPAQGPVAEGTNPPHGQPGHDCTIPVGAPLKK